MHTLASDRRRSLRSSLARDAVYANELLCLQLVGSEQNKTQRFSFLMFFSIFLVQHRKRKNNTFSKNSPALRPVDPLPASERSVKRQVLQP